MGIENDEVPDLDKVIKKPSLHTRLQSGKSCILSLSFSNLVDQTPSFVTGMNLQICFMNETASDGSDSENQKDVSELAAAKMSLTETKSDPYTSLPIIEDRETREMDFFAKQAKLQTEARTALTQAKELARVQMQVERQQRKHNRISDLVRHSLEKVKKTVPNDNISFNILCHLAGDSISLGVSSTESPNSNRDEHRSITSYCQ